MRPVLYQHWRSSSSWRVRWALLHKRIEFESVWIDLAHDEQLSAEHRLRNPMGYVPALAIDGPPGGRCLSESVAILEYLEETAPEPPLYPRAPWRRARARQVVELVNSGVQPLQNLSVLRRVSADGAAQKAWGHYFNERGLQALEALLQLIADEGDGGAFAVGDALTAADLYVVPQVASARRFGVDVARFVRCLAVEKAALATPAGARALPENQPQPARG
jgi:maleylacetoacetate isomerase